MRRGRGALGCDVEEGGEAEARAGEAGVNGRQRIASGVFAAFLWIVAFGAFASIDDDKGWLALAALLAGMFFALLALRSKSD